MYLLAILYFVKVSFILDDIDDELSEQCSCSHSYGCQHHAPCNLQFCLLAPFVSKHKLHDDCVTYDDDDGLRCLTSQWHLLFLDLWTPTPAFIRCDAASLAVCAYNTRRWCCTHTIMSTSPTTCDFLLLLPLRTINDYIANDILLVLLQGMWMKGHTTASADLMHEGRPTKTDWFHGRLKE